MLGRLLCPGDVLEGVHEGYRDVWGRCGMLLLLLLRL